MWAGLPKGIFRTFVRITPEIAHFPYFQLCIPCFSWISATLSLYEALMTSSEERFLPVMDYCIKQNLLHALLQLIKLHV